MPYVPGLADANHNEFPAPAQGLDNQLDRLGEGAVELRAHRFERGQLNVENFPGLGQMIHAISMPGKAAVFNLQSNGAPSAGVQSESG